MSERSVLALAGFSGTGKSTLAKYLVQVHGFEAFWGSAIVRQAALEADTLLESRGACEDFFRKQQQNWIQHIVLASDAPRVLQVGLRSPFDMRFAASRWKVDWSRMLARHMCI